MSKPVKRAPRLTLSDEPPFTLETVREILAKACPKEKPPAEVEIAELARILNGWQRHYMNDEALRPFNRLKQRARTSLASLADIFSNLKEWNRRFEQNAKEDAAPHVVIELLKIHATQIEAALVFVESAAGFSALAESLSIVGQGWHGLAAVLPEDFHNAMRPANPEFECGLGHEGPIAKFIAAVSPLMTGERPTPGSVATYLKKRRQAGKETSRHIP